MSELIARAKQQNLHRRPWECIKVLLAHTDTQVWEGSGVNWKQVWKRHWNAALVDDHVGVSCSYGAIHYRREVTLLSTHKTKEEAEARVRELQAELDS